MAWVYLSHACYIPRQSFREIKNKICITVHVSSRVAQYKEVGLELCRYHVLISVVQTNA
jgi:hypothetical protein